LQLNLFAIDGDHTGTKLDAYAKDNKIELFSTNTHTQGLTDCEIMDWLEALVCELQQQTGLAHAWNKRSD